MSNSHSPTARLIAAVHRASHSMTVDIEAVVTGSKTGNTAEFIAALHDLDRRLRKLHHTIAIEPGSPGHEARARALTLNALDDFDNAVAILLRAHKTTDTRSRFQLFRKAIREISRARASQAKAEAALGARWHF
jgi:hypothetical protein